MIVNLYLAILLILFILAFAVRNVKTYLATKKSIKGSSTKLTLSIVFSTIIYGLLFARLAILKSGDIWEIDLSNHLWVNYLGIGLVSMGFVIGILALFALKNSWRVGIKYDQKTDLVTTGIFGYSRNPYFLSYNIFILGYILVFPSPLLAMFFIPLTIVFHQMILEEEAYLKSKHKNEYIKYKNKVNRYI